MIDPLDVVLADPLAYAKHLIGAGIPVFVARNVGVGVAYRLAFEWQKTEADLHTLEDWQPGDALAMVCGRGVDGIDVDPRHGGKLSMERLQHAGLWPLELGRTTTPRGGIHALVNRLGIASCQGLMDGIDIRAGVPNEDGELEGGGFLWIPPTVRYYIDPDTAEVTSGTYEVVVELNPDEVDERDMSGQGLAAIHADRPAARKAAAVDTPHDVWAALDPAMRPRVTGYLRTAVQNEMLDMLAVKDWRVGFVDERGRGWEKVVADLAYRFGALARADWTPWTYVDAWAALLEVVPTSMRRTTSYTLERKWAEQRGRSDPAAWPALIRPVEAPGPVLEGTAATPDETETARAAVRERFPRLDIAAVLAGDRPEREWVVHGLLPARTSMSLIGPAGAGKSLLLLGIAVAVATGAPSFADLPIPRPRRVLYVDMENTEDDYAERLAAFGVVDHVTLEPLVILHLPHLTALDTAAGGLELLSILDAYNVGEGDLVLLDSFQRVVEGNEDESATTQGFYRHTAIHLKRLGATTIRTDNTGHVVSRARGSSAKKDDVDLELVLSVDKDYPERQALTSGKRRLSGVGVLRFERLVDDDGNITFSTERDSYRGQVEWAKQLLDHIGLPADAGHNNAWDALRTLPTHPARPVVRQAVRERKGEV